jgi:hypothetical protein
MEEARCKFCGNHTVCRETPAGEPICPICEHNIKDIKSFNDELDRIDSHFSGSPLNIQIGGDHYKDKAVQPVEYIEANNLTFLEGCVVKRITRWRSKNGIEDLIKAKHEIDLMIEFERRKQNADMYP